ISVALLSALAATLVPALRASREAVNAGVREGGRGATSRRLGLASRLLVTAELATSAVLLVVAGLTVRSILAMQHFDTGADTTGVLSARIALFEDAYPGDAKVVEFFAKLRDEVAAQPGVAGAAVTTSVPLSFASGTYFRSEGANATPGERPPVAWFVGATSDYFTTFRVPLVSGRAFDARDAADAPSVALVSRKLAQRAFGDASPVGRRLDLDPNGQERKWVEVVGVVGDVAQGEPEDDPGGTIYVPFAQKPQRYASIVLRAAGGDPYALADPLRAAVAKLDADLPVYFVRTVDDWIGAATVADRLMTKMFVVFAAFGTLLAAAGIYALLAFAVAQRTREIGVRRALGAVDAGIVRLVVGQGMRQLVVGLALGLLLGMALALVLRNVLFGVGVFDPVTFIVVAVVLAASMFLASWAPTRRALRIEPMQALRYE
ncbi:MAG TPA: ABC transporter permease, partial [Xanthomonadales bacterium]|nr:ABC transporter permease [Xanthomonadales bacterium]